MRILRIRFIVGILLLLLQGTSYGQDGVTKVTQDLETWSSIGLKIKPSKKITFGISQELRLKTNSSIIDQTFTQLSFKWKINKSFYLGTAGRFIFDRGNNSPFEKDFRIQFDFGYKHKLKRLSFNYRLRFQNRNEIGLSTSDGDYFKNYLRFKFGMKYNIKKWKLDPVFSTEIYRDLTKTTGNFDKIRFTLATDYSFKKFGDLGLFYRYERELSSSYPKSTFIIGLNYTYTIKRKDKND